MQANKRTRILIALLIVAIVVLSAFNLSNAQAQGSQKSNSWTVLAPMITARGGLGVAVVNGEIFAIGGLNGNSPVNANEEYNPATNQWTSKSPMPTARSGFAVAVYNNEIYCIGGTVGNNEYVGNNEVYDPSTNTWQTEASMPTPRADLSASVVNGKIYLIGGMVYSNASPYYVESNVTEVYDPSSNTWSTAASLPLAVYGYASAVLNGQIYVIGGSKSPGTAGTGSFVDCNQVYNPQNNTWGLAADSPSTGTYGAAAVTSGYMAPPLLYFVGGFFVNSFSDAVEVYNAYNNSWTNGAPMPSARAYLGLAVVNDVLYAIGGFDGTNWLNTVEQYTPIGYGTVPPQIQIISPSNETYAQVNLIYSVDRQTSWIGYSLDNGANVTLHGNIELYNLSQGAHSIVLYGNDSSGNMGASNTVFFSVNSLPPDIMMLQPLNQSYGSTDIQLVFSTDENVTKLAYSLDGQANVTIIGNVTLPALTNGSHSITIYATNQFGMTGSKTVYFSIAPFPTLTIVGIAASIIIVLASGYILWPKKKQAVIKQRKLPV